MAINFKNHFMQEKKITSFNDLSINKRYNLLAKLLVALGFVWFLMFFGVRKMLSNEITIIADILIIIACIAFVRIEWLYKNKKEQLM